MAKINNPSLLLFRSSAGSGKTRTLAKEYIKLALLQQPEYFRHILAVTFANKATQEMKERILQYLDDFANRRPNNLTNEMKKDLALDDDGLQRKSQAVLSGILHSYSQFAISTIDSFFQRVIRSFTREAGLMGNFRLEVEDDYVMDEVIAALMDELGSNDQLTEWVIQFSRDRLADGENWNVVFALKAFSKEIFKEQFKAIEDSLTRAERSPEDNLKVIDRLQDQTRKFYDDMQHQAQEAVKLLNENGITRDDFNNKDRGTALKYFLQFSKREYQEWDKATIHAALAGSNSWPAKASGNIQKLKGLAESRLIPILKEMVDYDKGNYPLYKSAIEVLKNYYAFGLITDITRKLRAYREENNVMLLSDAPKFLNGVINNSDTPFIYEKVGSWFRNYLIDEFQDTSGFQWKNFTPLLKEANDQGNQNLIVGDVKQSIYRWRGGDLELLQHEVAKEFGDERVEVVPLDTNYRSAGKIIAFNNALFRSASDVLATVVSDELPRKVFSDVEQLGSRWPDLGFVRMSFLEKGDDEEWQDQAIKLLPGWLERLQDIGAKLKDIAILVRKNEEGQKIANYLLQFQDSSEAKKGYEYDIVSNESLQLDTSFSVNVLISALKFLKNPDDKIARGQLAYEVASAPQLDELFVKAASGTHLKDLLPQEFISRIWHLKKLSLFELTEELIRIFHLGSHLQELAYLQAFQDIVLEFSVRDKTDVVSFLEWWELYKGKKSIKVSGSVDAVNILTIHMSKGLEFKYVIVPFCNWKLNHDISPLMWVQADVEPFKNLGPMVVRYSSSLDKTIFKTDYRHEFTKVHLDNLNLLYVAFTRAVAGLVMFAPRPHPKAERLQTVGDLAFKVLQEDRLLSPHITGNDFEWGDVKEIPTENDVTATKSTELKEYASADWREKLVIKREGSEFFEDVVSDKRSKINRGIMLHTVLSRIAYKTDAREKLDTFFLEHALPAEEITAISEEVNRVLEHPKMSNWFTREWKIKAEALVLLPGGQQKRIDRIMLGKDRTVIVDYKTGEKKEMDKEQVEYYATVLTKMGYPNVQAYLVYLKGLRVEEVISKSNLSLF